MSKSVILSDIQDIINRSQEFGARNKFPIDTTRCQTLLDAGIKEDVLLENVNSSYPIIHHSVVKLANNFLNIKRKYGSKVEKELYSTMDLSGFIDRLLR